MTEASWCIYTLICPLTEPATNHCPGNGLGHLRIVECPNVYIISLQLIIHYACEHWLIAIEPYDKIPTEEILHRLLGQTKTIDSQTDGQATKANLVSSFSRVSGELSIFTKLTTASRASEWCLIKYCKTFDSAQYLQFIQCALEAR